MRWQKNWTSFVEKRTFFYIFRDSPVRRCHEPIGHPVKIHVCHRFFLNLVGILDVPLKYSTVRQLVQLWVWGGIHSRTMTNISNFKMSVFIFLAKNWSANAEQVLQFRHAQKNVKQKFLKCHKRRKTRNGLHEINGNQLNF